MSNNITVKNFDPNEINQGAHKWASYSMYRGDFRVHAGRGPGMNRVMRYGGILYTYDDTTHKWVEVLRNDPDLYPEKCEDCGYSTISVRTRWDGVAHTVNNINFTLDRQGSKFVYPFVVRHLCDNCRNMRY